MSLKIIDFSPLDYLKTEESISEFLKAAAEDSDEDHVREAKKIAKQARRSNGCRKRREEMRVLSKTWNFKFSVPVCPWTRPSYHSSRPVACNN